jgi:Type I restriction enzyme R protein N terminus (HSDR_N)
MNTSQPDIVVISPDGEYLMIVEVKLTDSRIQEAIAQLKRLMTSMACSLGLVVAQERIIFCATL